MNNINPQYIDENGEIKMCSKCLKVKIANDSEKWVLDTVLYINPHRDTVYETCPACLNKTD